MDTYQGLSQTAPEFSLGPELQVHLGEHAVAVVDEEVGSALHGKKFASWFKLYPNRTWN